MQAADYMRMALSLAETAATQGEVPVGALIVQGDRILGRGFNRRETEQCAFYHAEMLAIQEACLALKSWRLLDCTLYVTLEPCLMCAGAIYQARIAQVVFGAYDPKAGAMGSLYSIHEDQRINHRFIVEGGIEEAACSQLLKDFFRKRRRQKAPH